uniref:Interleukin 18 receptor accessory protein n=1 Tax=Catharus ustulatus TaxID=91951 RepID=A0A8C3V9T7_CATUS
LLKKGLIILWKPLNKFSRTLTNCMFKKTYFLLEFVLQCALPDRDATNIYNNSGLDQHKVKWFWHQKDKETLMAIKESFYFYRRIIDFSFLLIFFFSTSLRGKIPCLKIVLDVQTKKAAKCSGYGTNTLYLLAGSGNSITCPGTKCYNHIKKPDVKWYKVRISLLSTVISRIQNEIYLNPTYDKDAGIYVCDYTLPDNITKWTVRTAVTVEVTGMVFLCSFVPGKPLELECRVQFGFETVSPKKVIWKRNNEENASLKGHTLLHVATLKEVTENDLRSNFTCFAENSVGNATAVIQLKKKQRVLFLYILCSAISTLLAFVLCTAFIYQHWIEIVLMYRSYLVHNKNTEDGKEFDAFVSYAKLNSSESGSALISEEKFALELLPDMLENKYGYKLCILERDILPGGAYTDDVVTAIKQSRRVIIILSPAYVSGPSIFELQAAVNCALEDKGIKPVLIKFQDFQEPETLPPVVKKALRILPIVTWKSSISAAPHKKFWKYMRYHMPTKTTKRLENCSLKGLSQRLFINRTNFPGG